MEEERGCRRREVELPQEAREEVDSLLEGLRQFVPDLPQGALPLRHLELILSALEVDLSPVDLQVMAATSGSGSEDCLSWDTATCLEYLMGRKSSPVEVLRSYRQLDRDGKGHISLEDMRRAAIAAGEDMADIELQELLEGGDSSKTGAVSSEDFLNFIKDIHLSLKEI